MRVGLCALVCRHNLEMSDACKMMPWVPSNEWTADESRTDNTDVVYVMLVRLKSACNNDIEYAKVRRATTDLRCPGKEFMAARLVADGEAWRLESSCRDPKRCAFEGKTWTMNSFYGDIVSPSQAQAAYAAIDFPLVDGVMVTSLADSPPKPVLEDTMKEMIGPCIGFLAVVAFFLVVVYDAAERCRLKPVKSVKKSE